MPSEKPSNDSVSSQDHSSLALKDIIAQAAQFDRARDHAGAARLLDEGLKEFAGAPAPQRFQALVLRADVAVSMNELIEARGILAEAMQVVLSAVDRDSLGADLRRADDLEVFLTHRGCAG
jgi:hypothetical protein